MLIYFFIFSWFYLFDFTGGFVGTGRRSLCGAGTVVQANILRITTADVNVGYTRGGCISIVIHTGTLTNPVFFAGGQRENSQASKK
jgi:hypothetical protein